ncbi:MAG: lysophospholipase L1-like esterase [Bacteroidia bacterium]|jgi:lysophospholipase L1-like esterase
MYVQSQLIRKNIPALPEATEPYGSVQVDGSKPFQLVTLGESTVAGVGVGKHSEGFTGTLAKELSAVLGRTVEWSVYAKSGYNAKKVHREILPQVKEDKIDLIVIGLGGNDAFEFTAPYWWERNICKLVTDIRSRFGNVPIAFANMPPVREFPAFSRLMHNAVGNQADYLGLTLINLITKLDNVFFDSSQLDFRSWIAENNLDLVPEDFFSDGVHPSILTYQKWAENYAVFLMDRINLNQ